MVVREGEEHDLLAEPADFAKWLQAERERVGDRAALASRVDEIRPLRDAIRSVLYATTRGDALEPQALETLNAASSRAPVAPQLEADAGLKLRVTELGTTDDSLTDLSAALARSAMSLITGAEGDRLQICQAPSCGMLFLGRRRWCCTACGNRARAARHYQRSKEPDHAGQEAGSPRVGPRPL